MTPRGYPLWLLRDWKAFFAFLIAFRTLIFAGFRAGRKAARGQRLSDLELQTLFQLYANAESSLDHAIWRQAWRACGYSAKHATFVQMPAPANAEELETRFLAYNRALREIEQLVVAYADDLRRRFKLSHADIGDPNAVGVAHARRNHRSISSSGALRRGRWRASSRDGGGSRDSRGLAQARAPPTLRMPANSTTSRATAQRERTLLPNAPIHARTNTEHRFRPPVTTGPGIPISCGWRQRGEVPQSRVWAGRPRVPAMCQEPERTEVIGRGRRAKWRRQWPVQSTR